jgi:hypothetical protein
MIESPLIRELMTRNSQETTHKLILHLLQGRFGTVPEDLAAQVELVTDEPKLLDLHFFAAICQDLEAFRVRLRS